jgi:hypothetical protein
VTFVTKPDKCSVLYADGTGSEATVVAALLSAASDTNFAEAIRC